MLLLIILTMVATILWWGTPTINALQVEAQYASVKGNFENLNREIKGMLGDGWGCSRSYKMSIPSGNLVLCTDTSEMIELDEVETHGEYKPKTVWVLSYNLPSSNYDVLFGGMTDEKMDHFFLRRVDDSVAIPNCDVEVESLQGETKGELQETYASINIDASVPGKKIGISLYDASKVTVFTNDKPIAVAYVFSLGGITYRYPTDRGTFHITQHNTGLSTNYPDSESIISPLLMSEASLSGSRKTLTLYMADFAPVGVYQAGSGDYSLKMKFSSVGYYGNQYIKDLRITMDGEYQETWVQSLSEEFTHSHQSSSQYTGFIKDDSRTSDEKGVIYNTPSSYFAEHQNRLMLNIIWAGVDVDIGS